MNEWMINMSNLYKILFVNPKSSQNPKNMKFFLFLSYILYLHSLTSLQPINQFNFSDFIFNIFIKYKIQLLCNAVWISNRSNVSRTKYAHRVHSSNFWTRTLEHRFQNVLIKLVIRWGVQIFKQISVMFGVIIQWLGSIMVSVYII